MSQRGARVEGYATPAEEADALPRRRRAALFVRGLLSASALGVYTVAAAVGALLALLPVILRPAPRGQASGAAPGVPEPPPDASRERLAG